MVFKIPVDVDVEEVYPELLVLTGAKLTLHIRLLQEKASAHIINLLDMWLEKRNNSHL